METSSTPGSEPASNSPSSTMMPGWLSTGFILACLAGVLWFILQPTFPHTLSMVKLPTGKLAGPQIHNITRASQAVGGSIIRPSETWSFHHTVGHRTAKAGYVPAPAYLSRETMPSPGGGICAVSSAVYRAALGAGLTIVERHPHHRPPKTIPPGFDATVWDYQWQPDLDLRLANPYPFPIEIATTMDQGNLAITIRGRERHPHSSSIEEKKGEQTAQGQSTLGLYRLVRKTQRLGSPQHPSLQVQVFRMADRPGEPGSSELVSTDIYELQSHSHNRAANRPHR